MRPPTRPSIPEWDPKRVGVALLLVGVALLAIAALVFAIVAWPRLSDLQRAGVLGGATLIAGTCSVVLRPRLPNTSEALAGLFLAFVAADWLAVRRAGVGAGLEFVEWWALGTFLFGLLSIALAAWLDQRTPRVIAAVVLPLSGVLWVIAAAGEPRPQAIGWALVAATSVIVAAAIAERADWRIASNVVLLAAVSVEAAAILRALPEISTNGWSDAGASAATLVALSLPFVFARALLGKRVAPYGDALTFVAAALIGAAGTCLLAVPFQGPALLAAVSVLAVLVAGLARFGPAALRNGVGLLGGLAIGGALVYSLVPMAQAVMGALSWFGVPWTGNATEVVRAETAGLGAGTGPGGLLAGWPVMIILTCGVASAAIATLRIAKPAREPLVAPAIGWWVAALGTSGILVLAPVMFALSIAQATFADLLVATAALGIVTFLDRRNAAGGSAVRVLSDPSCVASLTVSIAFAILGLGWASACRPTTLAGVGAVVIVAAVAALLMRDPTLVAGAAVVSASAFVAETALVGLAADVAVGWSFAWAAVAASLLVVAACWVRVQRLPNALIAGVSGTLAGAAVLVTLSRWSLDTGWPAVLATGSVALASWSVSLAPRFSASRAATGAAAAALTVLETGFVARAAGTTPAWSFAWAAVAASLLVVAACWARVPRSSAESIAGASGILAGAALLVTLGSWSVESGWPAVIATASVVVAAWSVTLAPRFSASRAKAGGTAAALSVALAGEIPVALDLSATTVAWCVFGASTVAFLAGIYALGRTQLARSIEAVGVVGLAISPFIVLQAVLPIEHADLGGVAAVVTAIVPVLLFGAVRPERRVYAAAAALAAIAAIWLWLATYGVDVVEAYTLPAAFLALGAGYAIRKTPAGSPSWNAYGPGLLIGLVPSLYMVLAHGGSGRSVALSVAAIGVVLLGVRFELRAFLEIGSVVLIVLGIDLLGPVVARMERWIVLGVGGIIFLWLGATIEQRRGDVRRARGWLAHMR